MSHFIDDLIIIFHSPVKKNKKKTKGVRIGEKVPQAEISGVCRTRRPGQTAQDDRRSGENLVPKSSHQMEVSRIDNNSSSSILFYLKKQKKKQIWEFEKTKQKIKNKRATSLSIDD